MSPLPDDLESPLSWGQAVAGVYPYRERTTWILKGRYAHLVKALDNRRRPVQDSVLEARVEAMRFWNRLRAGVIVLLSIGIAAAVAAWVASYMPTFDTALDAINRVTAAASAASGLLTLAYLFLTRLLGQIEADILAILTIDHAQK